MIPWKKITTMAVVPINRDILVYCPDDKPTIVSAQFIHTEDYSGWVYSDELLSDAHPEGPNPTYWAFAWTPEGQS